VVPGDQGTQSQADLDEVAASQRAADLADGMEALEVAEQAGRDEGMVQAGAENGAAVVMAFFPDVLSVEQGSTATWENTGNDPHVVSMERGVGPHDPQNFAPPSVEPGSNYTGGFVISGVFGAPFPAQSFSLRFVKPGEYSYVCPIHPGMSGTVKVTR
jgi:plastocyanin